MLQESISKSVWEKLYSLALKFRDATPWKTLEEEDIFGVQDPETSEIGYCSVMGSLGVHHALAVYLGPQGLESYANIRDQVINEVDAYFAQTSLYVSFEKKTELSKQERAIIKTYKIKIDTKNGCPVFRFHSPGYDPAFISLEQAQYLIRVLEIALLVVNEASTDNEFFLDEQGRYPVYYCSNVHGTTFEKGWSNKNTFVSEYKILELNDIDSARIKRCATQGKSTWAIDYFYMMALIKDKKSKPYHPRLVIAAEIQTESVLNLKVFSGDPYGKVAESLLTAVEATSVRPRILLVRRYDLLKSLEPICKKLSITLELVDDLAVLDYIKDRFEREV